jgi:hypothetical protein
LGYKGKNGPHGRICTRTVSVLSGAPPSSWATWGKWCSRQELHLRPSRSKRAALICCATGAEINPPTGHGAALQPSYCRRPAVCSGDGPASKARRGLWAKLDAPLGIAPRFTVSETVVLLLHYRARKWRGPTTRRQSDHDLLAMLYSDGISFENGEAQSPRIISSTASESSQRA